jgi:uncharacterized YigZ family protein
MEEHNDTFKTLSQPSEEILFKEKKSKFFGYAFPIESEADVKPLIADLKKKHHTANHVCYAWQLGVEHKRYRANDDGEPNNSAGMPIFGQIQAFEITNTLVAVVRIFGGTKLGVGGLISAYRTAAKMALEASNIIEEIQTDVLKLSFEYADMDVVMRIIKQHQLKIQSQELNENCSVVVLVRKTEMGRIRNLFESKHGIEIKKAT